MVQYTHEQKAGELAIIGAVERLHLNDLDSEKGDL